MTDREKLIELMRQVGACICNLCDGGEEPFNHSAGILADHLLANGVTFATENHVGGKWIPVTERLPVDWCPVLVMVREVGEPLLGSYRENVWFHERWNTTFIDGAVTHWMPIPEPPKEGDPK